MLIDALHACDERWSIAVLETAVGRHGTMVLGVPIVGGDESLAMLIEAGATHFAVGVGTPTPGDNRPRRRIFEKVRSHGLTPLTIVHPRAIVSRWASIGEGAQILPGAIVNAGARIGANTIVNSGAIVEHDCIVGDHVHVASGACLAGSVTVEEGAFVGARAVVRQLVRVGAGAVVGMGAAVIRDVPAATLVVGVPASVLRRL